MMISPRVNRWVRRQTARLRALPDFLIVGTQKGGTSSLYAYLSEHPRVAPATVKETHFFDKKYRHGREAYRVYFPLRATLERRGALTGEATPVYMFHPHAPARIAEWMPEARLIFLLRDPVERAWSHYRMSRRRGHEDLSFADAIEAEPRRLNGELARLRDEPLYFSQDIKRYSYCVRGHYAEQLERWLEHFDREQMLIMQSEPFFTDPVGGYRDVLQFLGLPDHRLADVTAKNVGEREGDLDPATRRELARYYQPWNERLFELLGVRYDWSRP